jgi:hypothetical protein
MEGIGLFARGKVFDSQDACIFTASNVLPNGVERRSKDQLAD